jgi:hypothetical protein
MVQVCFAAFVIPTAMFAGPARRLSSCSVCPSQRTLTHCFLVPLFSP